MEFNFAQHGPELFTQVYHEVQKATSRYVVVYGGASSSKSYSVHQSVIVNMLDGGEGDTLIVRKFGADIRHSSYKLLQTIISDWGLKSWFAMFYSNDQRVIRHKPSGRSIIFKGIDDPEKIKSIVGINRIIIEEASQLAFEDFLELNRRARGMEGIQIILILNPISENHWIKTKLCNADSPYHAETNILRFTYRDNCNGHGESFLTESDIRELERLKDIDENQYRIYVEGQWGVENKEGKFCWAFGQHQVTTTTYEPKRILWATFDFNINPLTCTLAQVFPEMETVRAIECIRLENSDIWKMCEVLNARYPRAIWMVTGDATGRNRTALARDNINYYYVIMEQLNIGSPQLHLPASNPPIEENRLLVNAVHKNWTIEIDPEHCAALIYDLTYVAVNGRGEIIKNRSSAAKFADFLDNWRYLINAAIRPHFSFRNERAYVS